MALGEKIKDSWEVGEVQAPIPHAEELSLTELAESTHIEPTLAIEKLQAAGFSGVSGEVLVADLAEANETSPEEVFALLRELNPANQTLTTEAVDSHLPTTGLGRLSLTETAAKLEMSPEQAVALLQQAGIEATPAANLKDLAEQIEGTPLDVVRILTDASN